MKKFVKLSIVIAAAASLAACAVGGHFQLGNDDTGIGAHANGAVNKDGADVGAGAGVSVLGHGIHVGGGVGAK